MSLIQLSLGLDLLCISLFSVLHRCIYFYNISSHSFSDGASVDTNSSCHLVVKESVWGPEHFFVHKDLLQISCLNVWDFVNEENAFITIFPGEVDALESFSTTYFFQIGGCYTGILIKVIRLLDRLCMRQLM